jgi:hypothetical protein
MCATSVTAMRVQEKHQSGTDADARENCKSFVGMVPHLLPPVVGELQSGRW